MGQALIPFSGNLHSCSRRRITKRVAGGRICVLFYNRVVRLGLGNKGHLNRDLKEVSKSNGCVWKGRLDTKALI